MKFSQLKIHEELKNSAAKLGFKEATPIQQQAIPLVLKKQDIIGLAHTGTGKTAAFVLPILHQLNKIPSRKGIHTLVLAPTRELAEQIHDVFITFGKSLKIRSTSIFGGVSINKQIKALEKGTDVVVACPGRLLDHLNRKTIKLSSIDTLVLDEADQMLDMGFLPDIKKIITYLPKQRQTLLFSATMPTEIQKLAGKILKKPRQIKVGNRQVTRQVAHSLYRVKQQRKEALLIHLVKEKNSYSTLVFTRTKHRARRLAQNLKKAGFKATSLHGNLTINQRRQAVEGFKKGKYHIMVATDIASRGIDISGISHVINFDVPTTPEIYVHRIGRTGRAAETGEAYTFASKEEMRQINQVERVLKSKLVVNKHSFN